MMKHLYIPFFIIVHLLPSTVFAIISDKPYEKVCLSSDTIRVECEPIDSDRPKHPRGQLTVFGADSTVDYVFWARRLYDDLPFCKEVARDLMKVVARQKTACISGNPSRNESSVKAGGKMTYSTAIDRVENDLACWSYFVDDCPKKPRRRGN